MNEDLKGKKKVFGLSKSTTSTIRQKEWGRQRYISPNTAGNRNRFRNVYRANWIPQHCRYTKFRLQDVAIFAKQTIES